MIAYRRLTDLITDDQVRAYVAAQQTQIDRDFQPVWNLRDECVFFPTGSTPPATAWQVLFLDHSDTDGALGYHTDDGTPQAKVFVADAPLWTVTASHETLEMLADPFCTKTVMAEQNGVTWLYALEVCDAPEDDQFAYSIDGVQLSDFVLPSWFDLQGKAPFSFRNTLTAPLTLAEGGYIARRETSPTAGAWTQWLAEMSGPRQTKGPWSRTAVRMSGE